MKADNRIRQSMVPADHSIGRDLVVSAVVPLFSISGTGEGLYWFPAPTVVVLADDVLAITGHPRCAVVALTAVFARFIAVPPVGKRVAA